MPLSKVDYNKAVIYRIYCLDSNIKECYIGLTTDFIRRKYQHKHSYQLKDSRLYDHIKEYGGWENWNMEIVYKFENDENVTKSYCEAKEGEFINKYIATLNTSKFDRKKYVKQWTTENLERIKEKINADKEIIRQYWANQYDVNTNPQWYLNNIKNRKY
jgi:hypothetical protein